MRSAIIGLAASLLVGAAQGQQTSWVRFAGDSESTSYLDTSRVRYDPYGLKTYRAWWRTLYVRPVATAVGPYTEALTLYRVNCDTSSLTQLQISGRNAGKQVWASGLGTEEISIPDSLGERFIRMVCEIGGAKS